MVEDNDIIEIDAVKNTITLKVADEEIAKRRAAWKQPQLKATKGILYKYAKFVKTAAEGCVTDEELIFRAELKNIELDFRCVAHLYLGT